MNSPSYPDANKDSLIPTTDNSNEKGALVRWLGAVSVGACATLFSFGMKNAGQSPEVRGRVFSLFQSEQEKDQEKLFSKDFQQFKNKIDGLLDKSTAEIAELTDDGDQFDSWYRNLNFIVLFLKRGIENPDRINYEQAFYITTENEEDIGLQILAIENGLLTVQEANFWLKLPIDFRLEYSREIEDRVKELQVRGTNCRNTKKRLKPPIDIDQLKLKGVGEAE